MCQIGLLAARRAELTFKGGWAGVKVAPQRVRHHSGRGAVLPFNQPEDTVARWGAPTPRGGRARPEPPISDIGYARRARRFFGGPDQFLDRQ